MSLPSAKDIETLDYSSDGGPGIKIAAQGGMALQTLDYSSEGAPFYGAGDAVATADVLPSDASIKAPVSQTTASDALVSFVARIYADQVNLLADVANGINGVYIYGTTREFQTFTPSVTGDLTSLHIAVDKYGSPANLEVAIKATSGGLPTGADLAVQTVPAGTVVANASCPDLTVSFTTPATLTSGTVYAIIVRQSGNGGDGSNFYHWYSSYNSNPYSNGAGGYSPDGVSWYSGGTTDFAFVSGMSVAPANPVCDQFIFGQHVSSGSENVSSSTDYRSQTFRASVSGLLTSVEVGILRVNGQTGGSVIVEVQSINPQTLKPSGTVLASRTVGDASIGSGSLPQLIVPFISPASLVAGTQYAIVLKFPNASGSATYKVFHSYTANNYLYGRYWISADSGSTWATNGTMADMYFATRMTGSTAATKTITSDAKVKIVSTQTVTAGAFCGLPTTRTITSDSKVVDVTSQTIAANAIVKWVTSRTIQSDGTIQITTTQTLASDTTVQTTATKAINAAAFIFHIVSQTLESDAVILATVAQPLDSDATVQVTTTQTVQANAFCGEETVQTITAGAGVGNIVIKDISSDAFCGEQTVQTVDADSVILATSQSDISADAHVQATTQHTIDAAAVVFQAVARTLAANAVIQATTIDTIESHATVLSTATQTIQSRATVLEHDIRTIVADATIKITTTRTILANAKVVGLSYRTILSLADIFAETSRTICAQAQIAMTVEQTVTSAALIYKAEPVMQLYVVI